MSVQLRIGRVDIGTVLARDASVQAVSDSGTVRTTTLLRAGAVLTPGSVVRALRQTVLRTVIDWATTDGLDLASATLSRRFMNYFYLEGGGGWDRDRGGFFELAFRADLNVGRFSTSNFVDRDGSGGLQRAEGSVLFGRRGRPLSFANGRSVGRAGLAGIVFLDLDGDGEYDPGEPPVPGARLRIGPWYVHADEQGEYATWDVVPFEALTIWVDPASGTDAQWTPATTRYVVRPDPNRFQPVNIPFVQTAEVMGEVRLMPANTALSGIEVQLIPEDGSDPYTTRTFSDGVFYVMGVRPGQYRVTVSSQTQDAYGVVSEDAAFSVEAGKTSVVEGIVLTLWKVDGSDR